MKIIGVVGQPSGGKDTVAEYIGSKGFVHISSGDYIREDMKALGLPLDRTSMSTFVAQKRKEEGNEYPVRKIADSLTTNTVIAGMRNTAEINLFKEKFGEDFIIVAVEAPIESRYEWAKLRGRASDHISFERFKEEEEKERANNSGAHEVDSVIKMADHTIINDSTKEALFQKVESLLKSIG
ncbi:MAG TPA: AAA family ATPase [Candidatus Paceibacterota bacterium]